MGPAVAAIGVVAARLRSAFSRAASAATSPSGAVLPFPFSVLLRSSGPQRVSMAGWSRP